MQLDQSPSFFTLACLLRASHQWNVPSCKAWAIAQLERDWPSSLDKFNTKSKLHYASRLVVLCRECEVTTLLQPAFYRLLSREAFDMAAKPNTGLRTPGSEPRRVSQTKYYHEPSDWTVSDFRLSRHDITLCLSLLEYVTDEWRNVSYRPPSLPFLSDISAHDIQMPTCNQVIQSIWHSNVTERHFSSNSWNPLENLRCLIETNWEREGICAACAEQCREYWVTQMVRIWDDVGEKVQVQIEDTYLLDSDMYSD